MKKIISLVLVLVMLTTLFPYSAATAAEVATGSAGVVTGNFNWDVDGTVLTISGTGDMPDYDSGSVLPWGNDITEVIIERGITSIGAYAFYNCKGITEIELPSSVTSIGEGAFEECSNLNYIYLTHKITNIGERAFYNTGYYKNEDNWQNDVLYMDYYFLIEAKKSLSGSCEIIEDIITIADGAFNGCNELSEIIIPDTVENIGQSAFYNCSSLTDVYYYGTKYDAGYIKTGANNDSLTNADWHYIITGETGDCTWIIDGNTLTIRGNGAMGNYDFYNYEAPWIAYSEIIEKIIIEEGVTTIGDTTFYDFTALTQVEIADSVTSIGMHSFSGSALREIDIPKNISDISYMAFVNCEAMTSYNVDEDNQYYCSKDGVLFSKDMSVLKVYPIARPDDDGIYTIPDQVTEVEGYAFSLLKNITKVVFGKNVKRIGDESFFNSSSLSEIEFNDGLEFIGGGAFQHCAAIEQFSLPETITKIRPLAFFDTAFYRNYDNWENSLLYIDNYLISGEYYLIDENWEALEENYVTGHVEIKDGTTLIAGSAFSWFNYDPQITSVYFPSSLKYINEYAFSGCEDLVEITLGSQVEWIDEGAFYDCSLLADVSLGANINRIGVYAFEGTSLYGNENNYIDGILYEDGYLLGYNSLPKDIVIKEGTTLIADSALAGGGTISYNNRTVQIPESLKYIGAEAFINTRINTIYIPKTVLSIGDYAYGYSKTYNYTTEEYDYIKISDARIDGHGESAAQTYAEKFDIAFVDLDKPVEVTFGMFTGIVDGDNITITKIRYDYSYSSIVEIPSYYNGKSITKIAANTLTAGAGITEIIIPDTITEIENGAFTNCSNVVFKAYCGSEADRYIKENGLNSVINHIFDNMYDGVINLCHVCENIECFLIGHDIYEDYCTRDGCEYFQGGDLGGGSNENTPVTEGYYTYVVKDGLAIITHVDSAISGDVVIPETLGGYSVTEIGEKAFELCTAMTSVVIPWGVKVIREEAFRNCHSLKYVNLGSTVTTICDYAFSSNAKLTDITIGYKVSNIGKGAFAFCPIILNVWYTGTEIDRTNNLFIAEENPHLLNADWHYDTCDGDHGYSGVCDSECNFCEWVRDAADHSYDNECDTKCNACGERRYVDGHSYSSLCDTDCDYCGDIRLVSHYFDDSCDAFCSECGYEREANHRFEWITDTKATCSTTGLKHEKCKFCATIRNANTIIPATNIHMFLWITDEAPSCGKDGKMHEMCTSCFAVRNENTNLPATSEHYYSDNCDTTCNGCGAKRTTNHKYDSGKVTKKATCKNAGVKTYTCSVCKNAKTETIAKLTTHTYSNNCDKTCNVCSKTRTVGSHKYSNNCDTTCNYCDAKRTIKHTYTNNCDTSCNVCKDTRKITHSYKTTTTKATLSKDGKTVQKCSVCDKVSGTTTIKRAKTFKLSVATYTYNGKTKKPTVTVKDSAGKTISSKYYTVTYKNNKNVGKATVTVTMKGNYSGTKTLTFKINPVKTSVSKLTAGKKSITVNISKKSSQVTGYQVQYSTSKSFSKATTKNISSYKTTKNTLKNLSAKKTYYVRVRTYKKVGSTTYYSDWSTAKSVKTK